MKKLLMLFIVAFLAYTKPVDAKPSFGGGISFGIFYSSLEPYGEWIEMDAGLYGWRPRGIHRNWRPYSVGRWEWTRDGWYWDSYEPFGWATYHYGRWYYDDYYGWIWMPDYEWGPSWVEWRYDDDYIGWAPLPPYASFSISFGIHFSINWHSGYHYWNFVPYRRFCGYRVDHYMLDYRRTSRIFDNTKYRSNYYSNGGRVINGGLDRGMIERRGGYRIAERDINNVDNYRDFEKSRSSGSREIYSYRPSDREVEKYRDTKNYEFRKNERETNLQRDKVSTTRERVDAKTYSSERNREVITDRNRSESNRSSDRKSSSDINTDRSRERTPETNRSYKEERKTESNYPRVQPERKSEPRTDRKIESNQNRTSSRERVKESRPSTSQKRESESKSSKSVERKR